MTDEVRGGQAGRVSQTAASTRTLVQNDVEAH